MKSVWQFELFEIQNLADILFSQNFFYSNTRLDQIVKGLRSANPEEVLERLNVADEFISKNNDEIECEGIKTKTGVDL
jgi:hypothetical protein